MTALFTQALHNQHTYLALDLIALVSAVLLRLFTREAAARRALGRPIRYLLLYLPLLAAMVAAGHIADLARGVQVLAMICFFAGTFRLLDAVFFDIFLRRDRGIEAPRILRDIAGAVLFVAGLVLVPWTVWGTNIGPILTSATVIGAVVALALQATLANLFSGLALQLEKSFVAGDVISVDGTIGQVMQMTWRSTKIRTESQDVLVVPNNIIAGAQVLNHSRPEPRTARFLQVGVSYDVPPVKAKRALVEAARTEPRVQASPPPLARLVKFDDSAIVYELQIFLDTVENHKDAEDHVLTAIWYRLRREGIEIPFPIRTVYTRRVEEEAAPAHRHTTKELEEMLRRIDFLSPLGATERRMLAESVRSGTFAPGEEIVQRGAPGDSAYLLIEGTVCIRIDVSEVPGSAQAPRLQAGAVFGEMSLLTGEPRSATVVAETQCEVLIIDRPIFREVLAGNEIIAARMSEILAQRQAELAAKRDAGAPLPDEVKASSRALLSRIRDLFAL